MQKVFSCHECKELQRPCLSIVDDATVIPDRCNFSTGSVPSKWVSLETPPAKELVEG